MPTKVWAPGEEVIAADFNPYVQEQVIPTFANAAARDVAMPAPHLGQHCFLNDLQLLQQYTNRTTPPSWRRPWSEPWGFMQNYVVPDMRYGTGVGYLIGAGTTALTVPGRAVRVRLHGWVTKEVDGADAHSIWRLLTGPPPHTVLRDSVVTLHQGWAANQEVTEVIPTDATWNQAHFQVWTSAGVVGTAWLRVTVEDMGPSSASPQS